MMKIGDMYIYKKGQIFRVVKIYNEPTILMELVGHNDQVIDTIKVWEGLKMKKLFP